MDKIESLALAISKTCGAFDPTSEAFQLNNPGLLKVHSSKGVGELRKFKQWQAGFKALNFDLLLKCSGNSRAKLDGFTPLFILLDLWEIKAAKNVVLFLQRALSDTTINENTQLEYFVNA